MDKNESAKASWFDTCGASRRVGCYCAVVSFFKPTVIRSAKDPDLTNTVNNARQIGLAMFEFEVAYGSLSQNSHAQAINQKTGNRFALSTIATSNDAFKQLLAAGIAGSEVMFYSKAAYSAKYRPDNDYVTDREMLKKGEVGFGYIMSDANTALNTEGNSGRALVVHSFEI